MSAVSRSQSRRAWLRGLGGLVLSLWIGAPAGFSAEGATEGWSERVVREGIAVRAEIVPLSPASPAPSGALREEETAAIRFEITDAATGEPLAGLSPAAWMSLLPPGGTEAQRCRQDVEQFVTGTLLKRPALDLNVYFVLALNQDASISVVDPLFGFGGSRLLALLPLLSPGEDWALTADQRRLFVSQPEAGRIAAVDTATWKIEAQVDAGPRPTRVALQPDGGYLWITFDPAGADAAGSGVAVVDARSLRVLARIPTGAGRHEIAFDADSRFAFVTNSDAGTVSVIDVRTLTRVKEIPTGEQPVSIAWSALAGAAYVTHARSGTIVAIDGQRHEVTARMTARPGLGQIRFAPGGRLGFAVNPLADALFIVDTASNRILQSGEMLKAPDQVAFTDTLAYVRHQGSETVLMIPLKEVGVEGKAVPAADFPGGQLPFGRGRRPSPAAGIVRAPGPTAVLVANPADQVIYFYKEGMAAPMGHFKNYDREPRAVLVVDRSLVERSRPGAYETVAKLRGPGRYELAFLLESPRVVHCFQVEVLADPVRAAERRSSRPVHVEPLGEPGPVAAGKETHLRFRLTDPNTGMPHPGLGDVRVLIHRTDRNWQMRLQAKDLGEGLYEIAFTPNDPADYIVRLESATGKLPLHLSPQVVLRVTAATEVVPPRSAPSP